MSDIIFAATPALSADPESRLAGLLERVRNARSGERNDVLNWAAHLVATSDDIPNKQGAGEALVEAALEAGLDLKEAERTVQSAYSARDVHVGTHDLTPAAPDPGAAAWPTTWTGHPRLHPIAEGTKFPKVEWQYPWSEPNRYTVDRLTRYGLALPPGTILLDVDDKELFAALDHIPPMTPARQQTPSGGYHFGYRLHPDRPVPSQQVNKAMLGYDTRVGGKGQIVVYDEKMLTPIENWPLAPDWLQPAPSNGIVNIQQYLSGVDEHPVWLVENLAFLHGVSMMSGAPKSGKSTLTAEALRCRETGEPFLGQQAWTGPSLLVTEEVGVPVRIKYGSLQGLDILDKPAAQGESFRDTLVRVGNWADAQGENCLVVIDTFAAWGNLEDENDSAQVTAIINDVKALAAAKNVAILLIHHSRKSGGQYGDAIRGSGAILASMDHVLEVKRSEHVKTQRVIYIMSRVLPEETQWLVDFDSATRRYRVLDAAAEDLKSIEEQVAELPVWKGSVEASPPGVTAKGGSGEWRRLNHLLNVGRVHKEPGSGRRPNLYWGIPPVWRDEEDGYNEE